MVVVVDKEVLREVENRLWLAIRNNFNYAFDNGEITSGQKIKLLTCAYDLKKYLGLFDYIDREYNEYLGYVKFLTEEDLSDNVKITKYFAEFYRSGCPGFLSVDIFQD